MVKGDNTFIPPSGEKKPENSKDKAIQNMDERLKMLEAMMNEMQPGYEAAKTKEKTKAPEYSEEEIIGMIPSKYRNLPPEVLEEMWESPVYIEEAKNVEFRNKKKLVLEFLRKKEAQSQKEEERKNSITTIENELGITSREVSSKEIPSSLSSKSLDNKGLHHLGSLEKEGVEGIFLNNDHGQDALAIEGDTYVISDGASSYGKAGAMSAELAAEVAKKVEETSVGEVFTKESLEKIITEIKSKKQYIDTRPVTGTSISSENKESALVTLSTAKVNRAEQTISFASIGDSPVIVVDRDEKGNITSFQIVNENTRIHNENFFEAKNIEDLQDPRTPLVGVRGDGRLDTGHVKSKKEGSIKYRPGRVVILASDAFTKMLVSCPEALQSTADRAKHEMTKKAFGALKDRYEKEYAGFWTTNPKTGEKMLNPLFFTSMPSENLASLLAKWKADNIRAADDFSAIAIDMDKKFGKSKV